MNIVIAGDGEVGFHLAELLSEEDHDITIIDPNEELLNLLSSQTDIMTIAGDSTSFTVLENANIKKADLLISVLHDEKINIITSILGKKLGAKYTIARVSTPDYLNLKNRKIFNSLGIDTIVCPERRAAEEVVNLLKQTAATEIYNFSRGRLSLFLLKLGEKAPVINKTLTQIAEEYINLNFRAIALHRNSKTIIPRGNNKFCINDMVYVITKPEGVKEVLKLGGKIKYPIKNIMIMGGGRVGRMTAKSLENDTKIKLFEKNKEKCEVLANYLENTLVINGDARNFDLLEEEGLEDMDAFVAVTDSSETNIFSCLLARRHGVKKTIASVENIDYIDISQNIGIDTIVNKKLITASYIAKFTMKAKVASSKLLSGIDAEVFEFIAQPDSPITKKPIYKLNFPSGAIIGGIVRGAESFIAVGSFQIKEYDRVVVFSLPDAIKKVEKLFH